MMTDESGQYDASKIRKNGGVWLPVGLLGAVMAGAIAWGTDTNRLTNAEQRSERMDAHLSASDQRISVCEQQIAVLKERLQFIIEQLQLANQKLDRAEEERRK